MKPSTLARLIIAAYTQGRQRPADDWRIRAMEKERQTFAARVVELEQCNRAADSVLCDAQEERDMAIVELRRVQAEAEAELERQRRLRESAEYQLTEQRKLNECMKAQHRVELARVVKLEHERRELAESLKGANDRIAELEAERSGSDAHLGGLVRNMAIYAMLRRASFDSWQAFNGAAFPSLYTCPEDALLAAGITEETAHAPD